MAKKHWIYIKRGLSEDPKHRANMGECVWLYMHIIDRADWETGIVYDWRDTQEAADMCMPVDTLRRQRQKLDEMNYIKCEQKQHGQNITIYEWRNPRDYGSEIKNPRFQGGYESPPSEFEGDNQGLNEGLNQVPIQVRTLPLDSKSKSKPIKQTAKPDFVNLTVSEVMKLPELRIFRDATGRVPGQGQWEVVWEMIRGMNGGGNAETLRPYWLEWSKRGYSAGGLGWLEWAQAGKIPERTKHEYNRKNSHAEFMEKLRRA